MDLINDSNYESYRKYITKLVNYDPKVSIPLFDINTILSHSQKHLYKYYIITVL